jgi:hypothetical protein
MQDYFKRPGKQGTIDLQQELEKLLDFMSMPSREGGS